MSVIPNTVAVGVAAEAPVIHTDGRYQLRVVYASTPWVVWDTEGQRIEGLHASLGSAQIQLDNLVALDADRALTSSQWAVTAIGHPGLRGVRADCQQCLDLAENAVAMARVTGSRGTTHSDVSADGEHSVVVTRAWRVVTV